MKYIILLISFLIFFASLFYHSKKSINILNGRYYTEIKVYLGDTPVAEEKLDISVDDGKFESVISVAGQGIDGIAMFNNSGIIEKKKGHDYSLTAKSKEIQHAEINDRKMLDRFRELNLSLNTEERSKINTLYQSNNVYFIHQNESSREYLLLIKK
ncbi:hypothetical protein [Vibrio cholerae]|uniref:hypothetical protein n=1 Tax=Vibrio cholerae TaxID=666 RepID=UPI00096B867A|nr:hypothetical protein [Vibrio cholerae]EGR2119976.1 hypothetical protein [Vibrio cholerae]EGR3865944.1 hypothetical protein [Vibrio cholerae]EHY0954163.1 hypothetical protein [Vibrio cholerae]EJK2283216.1 hypothetical protein [Vibrio cholerae]EJL6838284.1 hypothetical protein [Vibrio cholerae]